jgi:hypothetical protein
MIYKDEHELNLELWPHFYQFAKDVTAPRRQDRLAAYDLWHMTFKGVCIKRKMLHIYDEETWIRNRQIHERENRDAAPPPLTDAGRSGGQPTQPPR